LSSVAAVFESETAKSASDTAFDRFLETVWVAYVFIRHNALTIGYNKQLPEGQPPNSLRKDLF